MPSNAKAKQAKAKLTLRYLQLWAVLGPITADNVESVPLRAAIGCPAGRPAPAPAPRARGARKRRKAPSGGPEGAFAALAVCMANAPRWSATSCSPTDLLRSTIGARGLNFRVRNGTGCTSPAMVADQRGAFGCQGPAFRRALGAAQRSRAPTDGRLSQLVCPTS